MQQPCAHTVRNKITYGDLFIDVHGWSFYVCEHWPNGGNGSLDRSMALYIVRAKKGWIIVVFTYARKAKRPFIRFKRIL
jgi:hypothetical protein